MTKDPGASGQDSAELASERNTIQVLLQASTMLLSSSDTEDVLERIVELARQVIAADAYAVWRSFDGLDWRVLASYGLSDSYRTHFQVAEPVTPALQAVSDVEFDSSLHHFIDVYRAEGIRSLLVVPLQTRRSTVDGRAAGTITFYWRSRHKCSKLDVSYASTLANLSSAALNIFEANQQTAREKARFTFLSEASALLASSLNYEETLQRVAQLAVSQIADWCTVHVVDEGAPTRIVVAHADPALLRFARDYDRRFPEQIRDDRGVGLVIKTGKSQLITNITHEMLAAAIQDPEQLAMVHRLGVTSSILVPLTVPGKVLGVLRLLACGNKHAYDANDLQLAEDLGRRAATAIENARLHRAILQQQERLQLAHAAARMGTWHWDLSRERMAWSEEFRLLHRLQHNSASTVGGDSGLIHTEDRERVLREVQAALDTDAEYIAVEHRAVTGDGKVIWIHSRGRIERDAEGKAQSVLGISMDVTDRHHSEEALRKSEKLAAAGRLAATVAHEINNPLESIVNLVYLSRHAEGLPETASFYLSSADKELARIAHIVRQTLGFYRETSGARIADLSQVISDTIEVYRQRMESRSIRCETGLEPNIVGRIVPGELKQVISNLVANAIDATRAGECIRVSAKRDGESVVIAVADTGSGIPEKYLPQLFEPFFTTKEEFGTGLGLWVTKGIVEKHGGRIGVVSSTDSGLHGTTFTMTIPLIT